MKGETTQLPKEKCQKKVIMFKILNRKLKIEQYDTSIRESIQITSIKS